MEILVKSANMASKYEKMDPQLAQKYEELEKFRRIAFLGVAFSTFAVLICVVALPMTYNYVQYIHVLLQSEADFCRVRSTDLHVEYAKTKLLKGSAVDSNRADIRKRDVFASAQFPALGVQSGYPSGGWPGSTPYTYGSSHGIGVNGGSTSTSTIGACCTCHQGTVGPAGLPGPNGKNGADGNPGSSGEDGTPAPEGYVADPPPAENCACEAGPPGSPGGPGAKGSPGSSGDPGPKGPDSPAGIPGDTGVRGPPGMPGEPGPPGPTGPDGKQTTLTAPSGPRGPAGPDGSKGEPGKQGESGNPGGAGNAGEPGEPGDPGSDGKAGIPGSPGFPGLRGGAGQCDHCPNPRTAPGY